MTEPTFRMVHDDDPEMGHAYDRAAAAIAKFQELVQDSGEANAMAKLRFRDPDVSEQLGEDRFLCLWLSEVVYHLDEEMFSGVFFEVPQEFQKWHQVGQRLGFDPQDVFDWMVNDNGRLSGGFTIRVTRNRLVGDDEKAQYDEYIGVSIYEPLEL